MVNDRKLVPYDMLVLTCGRQFIRPDCPNPEIIDDNFKKFKETTIKGDDDPKRKPRKIKQMR